jgi:hypothetical protein
MAAPTSIATPRLGATNSKFTFPLLSNGQVDPKLWLLDWSDLSGHESWLSHVFATKYHRLNEFITRHCRPPPSSNAASQSTVPPVTPESPFELVPGQVFVHKCFKPYVAYEIRVQLPQSPTPSSSAQQSKASGSSGPTSPSSSQIGVLKIISFEEHLASMRSCRRAIQVVMRERRQSTTYMMHPWLEIIVLQQLCKSWFWGSINVDIHPAAGSSSSASGAASGSQRNPWATRYVAVFMSKFHSSAWTFFCAIQKALLVARDSPTLLYGSPAAQQERREIQDVFGWIMWCMFAQIVLKTLPHYKALRKVCHNDCKIDNIVYNAFKTLPFFYIRTHSAQGNQITLRIPTFERILFLMDFGYANLQVQGAPTPMVGSLASLMYTSADAPGGGSGRVYMVTDNLQTDFYQVMLSMLSFWGAFSSEGIENYYLNSLMTSILGILEQTMGGSPEHLKTAGTLRSAEDIRTFYVDASRCTINPLPLLLTSLQGFFLFTDPIPQGVPDEAIYTLQVGAP